MGYVCIFAYIGGAEMSILSETDRQKARNVAEYKTYGGHTMRALYEMLNDGRFTYGS